MKTYRIKNYKGNLVESLKRFSESHEGMKIVEACEKADRLEIKAEDYNQDHAKEIVKWLNDKIKDLFDLTISDDLSNGDSEHTKELLKMFEEFLKQLFPNEKYELDEFTKLSSNLIKKLDN